MQNDKKIEAFAKLNTAINILMFHFPFIFGKSSKHSYRLYSYPRK